MTTILLALAAKGLAATLITLALSSAITLVAITAVSMAYPSETPGTSDNSQGYTLQGLMNLLAEDEQ